MSMEFEDLLLNQTSRRHLNNYLNVPTQSLIISGELGVGLLTIAQSLSRKIAGKNVKIITPQLHKTQKTVNINIDDIREIVEIARSKRLEKFVIVIDEVEKLTGTAPQAFLKVLEEPTTNLYFILTTHFLQSLPKTIVSRAQLINILPVDDDACAILFNNSSLELTVAKTNQIKFLAAGCPAEISRLLDDESYFRSRSILIQTAKSFLQTNYTQRLQIINETATREAAIQLLGYIGQLLLLTSARAKSVKATVAKLNTVATTLDNLNQNGNVRIQLINLALNL